MITNTFNGVTTNGNGNNNNLVQLNSSVGNLCAALNSGNATGSNQNNNLDKNECKTAHHLSVTLDISNIEITLGRLRNFIVEVKSHWRRDLLFDTWILS